MSLFSITPVYSSDAIKAIEERVDASSSKRVLYFLCFDYLLIYISVHLLLTESHINDLDRVVSEEIKDKTGKGSW